ncbi:MAG: dTDP-4-dehydrorhamnose 3,5-epimerase [Chloroflexi bacterium]|nr:dTDP-4-dehydrorhamnose 3,5-epimerase [Chloroflexota bacterium]
MPFRFRKLELGGLVLIEPSTQRDARGFFRETYKQSEFAANGIAAVFVQDNYSFSARGVLRGLHYQKHPQAQGKLVAVGKGEIFDVAVDIRRGSPTYARWLGEILSAENGCMLYVPPGFAHGFCVLSDEAAVTYKVTAEYAPELDRGIIWNDPEIGIEWPVTNPSLSPKDAGLPLLKSAENNFEFERISE